MPLSLSLRPPPFVLHTDRKPAVVGTRRYMAPEMMQRQPINEKADIYSYGVLLWQILTRKRPFGQFSGIKTSQEKKAFCDHVSAGNRPEIPLSAPPILAKLINRCWTTDPQKRPNFQVVVETLEQVMLSSIFSDDGAHNFWLLRSPTSCYDTLGMDWKSMRNLLIETVPKSASETDWNVIKRALCSKDNTEFVLMETFSSMANCFAPFYPPHKWLARMQEVMTAKFTTTALPLVEARHFSGSRIGRSGSLTACDSGADAEFNTLGDSTKGAIGSTADSAVVAGASGEEEGTAVASGAAAASATPATTAAPVVSEGGTGKAEDTEEAETEEEEDKDLVFYPGTSSSKAYSILQGKAAGTFLLRSAEKVRSHLPFTVSYVTPNGAISHSRIHYDVSKRVYFVGDMASAAQEGIVHFLLSPRVRAALGLRCAVSSSELSNGYVSD